MYMILSQQKHLCQLKKADHDSLVTKIRNAHAVGKHNLSFRTYSVICKLDEIKGIPIGSQYCSDKAGAEFCESIARSTRSEVVETLQNCSWCSFTCDGSTDFMGKDMETVYLRTCTKGNVQDIFLHLGSGESSSSLDIFNYILSIFEHLNIYVLMKDKLVGFCADGASNMQG